MSLEFGLLFVLLYYTLIIITILFCLTIITVVFILSYKSKKDIYQNRKEGCVCIFGFYLVINMIMSLFFSDETYWVFDGINTIWIQFSLSLMTIYLSLILYTENVLKHKVEHTIIIVLSFLNCTWATLVMFVKQLSPGVPTFNFSYIDEFMIGIFNGEQINTMLRILNVVGIVSVIVMYVVKKIIYAGEKKKKTISPDYT